MIDIIQTIFFWVIAICACNIAIDLREIRKQNEHRNTNL